MMTETAMPAAPATDVAPQDRVHDYLQRSGLADRGARAVPLTGDASDRRYFRILVPNASSLVLAVHAGPIDHATLPFLGVADLFRRMEIPVPAIAGHADDLGILALEDLGDVTLQAHLGTGSPRDHAAWYSQAVDLIVAIQERAPAYVSPRYPAFRVAFDEEKLMWEMDFFIRHFLEAYHGAQLSGPHREALRAELGTLVRGLAAEPRVLCHRDYHSRNLMLHGGRLYVIDFQDARMGPDTYDLVSLLRDSYADLDEEAVGDLIRRFLASKGGGDAAAFRARFDAMALQRNLKALGTFGYQTTTRGNPVYIQYIPRTIRYVRDNLARHPVFGGIRDLLAPLVEGLG
jgi:aminoglycoside/choline kinase family phosphotransferase